MHKIHHACWYDVLISLICNVFLFQRNSYSSIIIPCKRKGFTLTSLHSGRTAFTSLHQVIQQLLQLYTKWYNSFYNFTPSDTTAFTTLHQVTQQLSHLYTKWQNSFYNITPSDTTAFTTWHQVTLVLSCKRCCVTWCQVVKGVVSLGVKL
jgi:hypothetical protein